MYVYIYIQFWSWSIPPQTSQDFTRCPSLPSQHRAAHAGSAAANDFLHGLFDGRSFLYHLRQGRAAQQLYQWDSTLITGKNRRTPGWWCNNHFDLTKGMGTHCKWRLEWLDLSILVGGAMCPS